MVKASANVVFSLAISNRLWFGITISVSTYCCISSMPASAMRIRLMPSNRCGLVTTPTVKMPCSRANRNYRSCTSAGAAAHTGQDKYHVSCTQCFHQFVQLLRRRAADIRRDPEGAETMRNTRSKLDWPVGQGLCQCLTSVFATTKSTPSSCDEIMLLTALPPRAPPTPITVIRGFRWS